MLKGFFVWVLILVVAVGLLVYFFGYGGSRETKRGTVEIRGRSFQVEVADTPLKQEKGLSGRKDLAEDEGMLFVFASEKFRTFWMKDTLIPLDIIWIRDGKIIGFAENAQPEPGVATQSLRKYRSPRPVELVLELNAGSVERYQFEIGDPVNINL